MAKPVKFGSNKPKAGSTSFNFGANKTPRGKRRGGKGGGS